MQLKAEKTVGSLSKEQLNAIDQEKKELEKENNHLQTMYRRERLDTMSIKIERAKLIE